VGACLNMKEFIVQSPSGRDFVGDAIFWMEGPGEEERTTMG